LCTLIYWFIYSGLLSFTKCSYDDNGELIDAGIDLNIGGLSEYYFDVIYITWFVQLTTIFSDWFWMSFLLIPGFAFFKLWTLVIGPYLANVGKAEPVTEKERKRMEKAERHSQRTTRFVKGR